MKNFILVSVLLCAFTSFAQDNSSWTSESYAKSFEETVQSIENILHHRGFKIFSVIKHSQEAKQANLELRPTTLIIFGNPKVGTHLMNCDPRIAYHLPLKILVWEEENAVKAGFIKTTEILADYNLTGCENMLDKIDLAISDILKSAQ